MAHEDSQFDARQYDTKMNELLGTDAEEFFTSYDKVYDSFDAMGLQENLLRGIYAYGFEKPTAIQQRGIVPFCKGLDVIQQAQSRTGKTATFCSGILQQLDYNVVECQALVLAPTRELAQQIMEVIRALGNYLGVKVHACVGGTIILEDQRILSSGVHVVVGTPGRVFNMMKRQSLRSDYIKMFVLDEANEMLSKGFKDQIYDIFQLLPPKTQVGVFSATMHPEALDITRKFMNKPVRILVKCDELTLEGFEKPSTIQQRSIVPFCKRLDVIQQAQSETGKTATFCSGILQQLDYDVVECQALVLAPTRELSRQIEKVIQVLGDYLGVKVHACVGGTIIREDQRILSSGVHVVVGTPGRVFDMMKRQSLHSDYIKMFVLDEEMLSKGFKDQIDDIFQLLPPKTQVGVFSATTLPEALDITKKFMNNPERIRVKRDELTLEGFEEPSAIQQRGIVPFCKGLDVIQQAQSGTGKSVTCSGILQQLDYNVVECQALVLAPTRELAQQIEVVMRALGDYLGVKVHSCVGGTIIREDRRILSSGVHVVVGTPGRVLDMMKRQSLRSDYIKMFVLDEADEMLSKGFKDQIDDIFQLLPPKTQVGVFSATTPPEALDITKKFMNNPEHIRVKRDELTLEGLRSPLLFSKEALFPSAKDLM